MSVFVFVVASDARVKDGPYLSLLVYELPAISSAHDVIIAMPPAFFFSPHHQAPTLRQRAQAAATAIHASWPATRIRLFGSVARGTCHANSDIDLVVEGLPPGDALQAWLVAERAAETEHIDVLRYEDCPTYLREAIDAEATTA
jgi:predicted nucleotidyltransferase